MELQKELEHICRVVQRAGEVVLEVYGTNFGVEMKGVADPVTEADKRANTILVDEIARVFADDGIVAEESVHADARQKERCWYVDPLDGTKEFIAKNGEFSIMVGLAIGGTARLGVVFQPVTGKLYSGVVGEGAWLRTGQSTRELRVSETSEASKLRLVTSRSHRDPVTDEIVKRLGITAERPSGSVGLKVGLIAEREADLYVHPSSHSSVWDSCGPEAILRAAGGRFTNMKGEPFVYRGVPAKNEFGILATNARAFDVVMAALQRG